MIENTLFNIPVWSIPTLNFKKKKPQRKDVEKKTGIKSPAQAMKYYKQKLYSSQHNKVYVHKGSIMLNHLDNLQIFLDL